MRRHPRVLLALLVLTCVAVLAGAAARSHDAGPGGVRVDVAATEPRGARSDTAMNLADAVAVCSAFATALATRDAATDAGPADAYVRAAVYADQALADALLLPAPPRAPGWAELSAHRAQVVVTVEPVAGETPPDRAGLAYRAVAVIAVAIGRDGWRRQPERHIVHCTLRLDHPWWLVAAYDLG